MYRSLLIAIVAAVSSLPAHAQRVGDWEVTTKADPATCAVLSPAGPTRVRIENQEGMSAKLVVILEEKVIDSASSTLEGVTFGVDGHKNWTPANVNWNEYLTGGFIYAVVASDMKEVLVPISKGNRLDVSVNGNTYSVPLKGSSRAMKAFEKCLDELQN